MTCVQNAALRRQFASFRTILSGISLQKVQNNRIFDAKARQNAIQIVRVSNVFNNIPALVVENLIFLRGRHLESDHLSILRPPEE